VETFVQKAHAPLQLFPRRQFRLAHGVVKFTPAHDSPYPDLGCDVGEAGDQHHGNFLLFDFFADRSAATRAGSSRGGQNDSVDAG
jgi:hypothetical protein